LGGFSDARLAYSHLPCLVAQNYAYH
jgi:hypothetical protein